MALKLARIEGDRFNVPIVLEIESQFIEGVRSEELRWVLDAPFQRGSVWTLRQKRAWIETLIRGLPLPAIFVNRFAYRRTAKAHPIYGCRDVVIDGKQRIEATRDFLLGKFKVQGERFADQTDVWKRTFTMYPVCPVIYSYFDTLRECAELYVKLLTAGTAHTPAEIQRARKYLQTVED